MNDSSLVYQSGFGNHHACEAVPGGLPVGQNNPQKAPLGLYPELLSGTAFTVPRAMNARSWLYRIRPSTQVGSYQPYAHAADAVGGDVRRLVPPDPMRWSPVPVPPAGEEPLDFIDGLRLLVSQDSLDSRHGVAVYLALANRDMRQRAFVNGDGELLVVPQQGRLLITTELGRMEVAPWDVALLPRGMAFKVEVPDGQARAFVCENRGAAFRLPELGPIGSNGLAQPRDWLAPVAAFEQDGRAQPYDIVKKFRGRLWVAPSGHSPFNVVAWHGNLAPYKYDLRRFVALGSISIDHPDPSIFTVLTSPSDTPGVANCDFVIFPPRWQVAEHTFRPPWYHRNVMSEFMALIEGRYDAKPQGFQPGGFTLHNGMVPHGPDAQAFVQATQALLAPQKLEDTLAFMLESHRSFIPSGFALGLPGLDTAYADCWAALEDRFTP